MTTIFISYAREDTARAQELSQEFQMRGADVWWDRNLLSGERYIEAILRQVQHADHVLCLLSKHSAASTWVAFEVGAARAREVGAERDVLKVAQLDECVIPGFVGERQSTSLSGGDYANLMRLLPALGLHEEIDYKRPAGAADRALTVFRAGGQWMELIKSRRGLDCVLVDAGEERARIQWSIPTDRVAGSEVSVDGPREGRSWSTFNVGACREWRWSPALFTRRDGPPPEQVFQEELGELLGWSG